MRAKSERPNVTHAPRLELVGIRPAPKPRRNRRPRPPRTVRVASQPPNLHAALGALNKALWREDWQTVGRIERQIDNAVLGQPWTPDL